MELPFRHGDGCGNRFVVVFRSEWEAAGFAWTAKTCAATAGSLCVVPPPSDGLLLVDDRDRSGPSVRIVNRDGSDGGACLNGLRVVALALGGDEGVLRMAGREVAWRRCGDEVELFLGDLDDVPVEPLGCHGFPGFAVGFWNPHAVFFLPEEDGDRLDGFRLADFAGVVRRSRRFPDGVNVTVAHRSEPGVLRMRVDERGVGETAACGSAAVAAALARWCEGAPERLRMDLRGGVLTLSRDARGGVRLRAAAHLDLEPQVWIQE